MTTNDGIDTFHANGCILRRGPGGAATEIRKGVAGQRHGSNIVIRAISLMQFYVTRSVGRNAKDRRPAVPCVRLSHLRHAE